MDAELSKAGFKPMKEVLRRRLILSIEAMEKEGKTHFSLTAPAPIAYFGLDIGHEGVVGKFLNGVEDNKIILSADDGIRIPDTAEVDVKQDTLRLDAEAAWDKMRKRYKMACESDYIRTIVMDTATEMWELIRLARLGKLAQVKPQHYGPVNAEMRGLIRNAYDSDKNVIFIHKLKKEYVQDRWSGMYERSGFGDIGYLVQVCVRLRYDPEEEEFVCKILNCRQNTNVRGTELTGDMCSFPFLAATVFPDTKLGDWS